MLKLALIKAEREPASTRALIVFASDEARLSITGWVREAVDRFGVRLMTVDRRPILELGGHVGREVSYPSNQGRYRSSVSASR